MKLPRICLPGHIRRDPRTQSSPKCQHLLADQSAKPSKEAETDLSILKGGRGICFILRTLSFATSNCRNQAFTFKTLSAGLNECNRDISTGLTRSHNRKIGCGGLSGNAARVWTIRTLRSQRFTTSLTRGRRIPTSTSPSPDRAPVVSSTWVAVRACSAVRSPNVVTG